MRSKSESGEKVCVFHHYPEVEERREAQTTTYDVCEQRGTACSRLLEIREKEEEGREKAGKKEDFKVFLALIVMLDAAVAAGKESSRER